jgi:hypothetical protein
VGGHSSICVVKAQAMLETRRDRDKGVTSEARELRGKAVDPRGSYRKTMTDDAKLNESVGKIGRRPAPRWCPKGLTKMQRRRLQKMRQREIAEKEVED